MFCWLFCFCVLTQTFCFRSKIHEFCLSIPDDCWVKLTSVQVDQTKGDGNGKLPCHTEGDGQSLNVLWSKGGGG